jgi:hypothetical protein
MFKVVATKNGEQIQAVKYEDNSDGVTKMTEMFPDCQIQSFDLTVEANIPSLDPQLIINYDAQKYLADTDWYVIRKLESNIDVPTQVLADRAAARLRIVR